VGPTVQQGQILNSTAPLAVGTLDSMRTYGQYCPIARGADVLAERWTPIIMRNVLLGCRTFNEIAAGAPGLSRALLTTRLRDLERTGLLSITPKPSGRGSWYEPTEAGRDAWQVLAALGDWGDRWTDILPEHADPNAVLWSWCHSYQRTDQLPDKRVVVRFDFRDAKGRPLREWFHIENQAIEICRFDPGFGDDLVVSVDDPVPFARWHIGLVEWGDVLRSGVTVTGPATLRRALPGWNAGPDSHKHRRAASAAAETAELTGSARDHDRVLATVLLTDIVESTRRSAELGDRDWTDVLDQHDRIVRLEIERFRGRHVKHTGDGTLAVFDAPARAIGCACAIRDEVRRLGLETRAGVHTGEVALRGDDIAGIAVHISARVSSLAEGGEVLVSGAVPPLVIGSDLRFDDRGEFDLRGVPGTWRVHAVGDATSPLDAPAELC
jgi:class 3 adenylate cyclase/DNA-binding HxlR family transcriptional regulator